MELNELLAKAWEAVEKSGVPESLQDVAFKEAVEFLRASETTGDSGAGGGNGATGQGRSGAKGRSAKPRAAAKRAPTVAHDSELPDEGAFFGELARESGVDETDLRDILQLTSDGRVQVTPPTKDLGGNKTIVARTVVALVASARGVGLGESPINADAVRREVERKRALDTSNFSALVIGKMKGFNAGSNRNELVMTSKWLDEFKAAVDLAHGRNSDAG